MALSQCLEPKRSTQDLLDLGSELVVVAYLPVGVSEVLKERGPLLLWSESV